MPAVSRDANPFELLYPLDESGLDLFSGLQAGLLHIHC